MLSGLPLLWLQLQIAFDASRLMNKSVDPCVDFYDFACGNYDNFNPIPDDRSYIARYDQASDNVKKNLRVLLQEQVKPNDAKSTVLVKHFYQSCMDVNNLEALGLSPLKSLIKKYGDWPVVEGKNWNSSDYDWMKSNAILSNSISEKQFLTFAGGSDLKNGSRRILFIDQAALGMEKRNFYVEKDKRPALDSYLKLMTATAVQLGATEDDAKKEMKDVLDFETALAEASVRDEDRRNFSAIYRPMTVEQLKDNYDQIKFSTWFETAAEAGLNFGDDDKINLQGQPFLEKLPVLLRRFSGRTLANYQMWLIVQKFLDYLAPSLRENLRQFQQAIYGQGTFKARWEECIETTMGTLKMPLGATYVKKYLSDDIKKELEKMVTNIKDAMKSTISSNNWMDDQTKRNAQNKLEKMQRQIAFPSPDIYNDTWVMRDFAKANVKPGTYLDNCVSIILSLKDRYIREFFDPVNRTEWNTHVVITNAFYDPTTNKMFIPAGILLHPFYVPYAPNYVNYGRIGCTMGHELTHGFDDRGRQFDEEGNLNLWWTNETLKKFTDGAKCFINEYGNITDVATNLTLNGENTQGENIADNGGLKLAYKAYRNAEATRTSPDSQNVVLLGFSNYTRDQLFFLSFAQVWCINMRLEMRKYDIVTDSHSPGKYRVNVPLMNNPDFAAAFKCPNTSPMNPQHKCQIW